VLDLERRCAAWRADQDSLPQPPADDVDFEKQSQMIIDVLTSLVN